MATWFRSIDSKIVMSIFGIFPSVNHFIHGISNNHLVGFLNQEKAYYQIGGANQVEVLRVPITHETKNQKPEYWEISYHHKWVKEHKNAWKTAYGKSPFYQFYDYKLERILDKQITSFKELQITMTHELIPWLGFEDIPFKETLDTDTSLNLAIDVYHEYCQVFETKFQHRKNLSIIDLIFNLGPETASYFRLYKP